MASLALAFDILARDKASATFDKVGDAADRSGRQIDKAGDTAGRSGRKFGGIGVGAAAFGTAVAGAAVGFGAFALNATNAFAAVEDATGAAGVQFGKTLPQVTAFADQAFKSFGLSKRAALEAQNTFGTLGKSAGLQGKPLADFSAKFAGLAGDLASFKGTSTEQAIEAVGAALRGESEPIRAYGVLLDDASLRQEALAQGLITTTKTALTPQQKVLATQALIFKQTSDAQGDFARTSDSTANTQKRLQAATENAKAALGEKLAPTITAVRGLFLKLIEGAGTLIDKLGPGIGRFVESTKGFFGSLSDKIQTEVVPRIREFGAFFVTEILPRVQQFGGYIRDTLVPIVQRFVSGSVDKARAGIADLKVKFEENKGALKVLGDVILAAGRFIVEKLVPAFLAVSTFIAQRIIPAFGLVVDGLGFIVTASINVGRVFLGMVGTFLGGLGAIFAVLGKLPGKFGEPFRQASASIAGAKATVDTLKGGLDVLGQKIARPRVELVGADGALGSLSRLEAKLKNTGGIAKVYQRGGNTSGDGPGAGGPMLARISKLLPSFPGLSVSSAYRTAARNAAIGGSPTSFHLDRVNPAVDVVGPTAQINRLFSTLRSGGGLRELLWQVPGHYDHLHAADQGGIFKGPGLVKMGPGYETFASGLRPAQKVADLPSGNGGGVTMNYYGDVHTVDVDEFTRKQTARMRDLIAVGGLA